MTHPFFDEAAFPWHRPEAKELHAVLATAIPAPGDNNLLYQQSSVGLLPLTLNQPPHLIWMVALDRVAVAGALRELCAQLVRIQAACGPSSSGLGSDQATMVAAYGRLDKLGSFRLRLDSPLSHTFPAGILAGLVPAIQESGGDTVRQEEESGD